MEILMHYINNQNYNKIVELAKNNLSIKYDKDMATYLVCSYIELGDLDNAENEIDNLLKKEPKDIWIKFLKARVSYMKAEYQEVINILFQCISKFKNKIPKKIKVSIYNLLGATYKILGDSNAGAKYYYIAYNNTDNDRERIIEYSNYLFCINYLDNMNDQEVFKAHSKYNELFENFKTIENRTLNKKSKIRIGYISPDFRKHVVVFFSFKLLANYDKNKFEVICYAKGSEDGVTSQLKTLVDGWRNINNLSEDEAAILIKNDEIDILFDLSGHTANSCLPILARKPAPIQISGIGYFNTTGLKAVDYFLTDINCDPIGANDNLFIEKLLRLPHTHFCYTPSDEVPEVEYLSPQEKKGYITFGSFNNFTKVTDEILLMWKKIMDRFNNSKLLLKSSVFNSEYGTEVIKKRLERLGFDLTQIELRGFSADYLEEYNEIDIALDTYPYPGGGTTCDALYMGVPVITLVGERHGSRFGYSILKNIEMEECIAFTKIDYIEKAISLANDTKKLKQWRKILRGKMEKSPLMNGDLYMDSIEQSYIRIYQEYLDAENRQKIIKELIPLIETFREGQIYIVDSFKKGDFSKGVEQVINDTLIGVDYISDILKNEAETVIAMLNNIKSFYIKLRKSYQEKKCNIESNDDFLVLLKRLKGDG